MAFSRIDGIRFKGAIQPRPHVYHPVNGHSEPSFGEESHMLMLKILHSTSIVRQRKAFSFLSTFLENAMGVIREKIGLAWKIKDNSLEVNYVKIKDKGVTFLFT